MADLHNLMNMDSKAWRRRSPPPAASTESASLRSKKTKRSTSFRVHRAHQPTAAHRPAPQPGRSGRRARRGPRSESDYNRSFLIESPLRIGDFQRQRTDNHTAKSREKPSISTSTCRWRKRSTSPPDGDSIAWPNLNSYCALDGLQGRFEPSNGATRHEQLFFAYRRGATRRCASSSRHSCTWALCATVRTRLSATSPHSQARRSRNR